jgi:hypothetical protein
LFFLSYHRFLLPPLIVFFPPVLFSFVFCAMPLSVPRVVNACHDGAMQSEEQLCVKRLRGMVGRHEGGSDLVSGARLATST